MRRNTSSCITAHHSLPSNIMSFLMVYKQLAVLIKEYTELFCLKKKIIIQSLILCCLIYQQRLACCNLQGWSKLKLYLLSSGINLIYVHVVYFKYRFLCARLICLAVIYFLVVFVLISCVTVSCGNVCSSDLNIVPRVCFI